MRLLYLSLTVLGPIESLALPLSGTIERRSPVNINDFVPEFNPDKPKNEQTPEAAQQCLEREVGNWLAMPGSILSATIQNIIDICQMRHGHKPAVNRLPTSMKETLQTRANHHIYGDGRLITEAEIASEPDPWRRKQLQNWLDVMRRRVGEAKEWYGFPPEKEFLPEEVDDPNSGGHISQFSMDRQVGNAVSAGRHAVMRAPHTFHRAFDGAWTHAKGLAESLARTSSHQAPKGVMGGGWRLPVSKPAFGPL